MDGSAGALRILAADGLPRFHATPGFLIRSAQQVHTALWARRVSREVTSVQYGTMLAIAQYPGADQRMIGSMVSLDKSSIGSVLQLLEERGILDRRPDQADARRKLVSLTRDGERRLRALAPMVIGVQEEILSAVPDDRRDDLVRMLRSVGRREATARTPWGRQAEPMVLPELVFENAPGHLIRLAEQIHTEIWRKHVASPLTSPQYSVIVTLLRNPGIDQRTVGEHCSLDKSTSTDVVRRLVARGLIDRTRHAHDARRYVLQLTSVAREQAEDLASDVVTVQWEMLRPLIRAGDHRLFVELLGGIVRGQG